jgi:hypothetical protein
MREERRSTGGGLGIVGTGTEGVCIVRRGVLLAISMVGLYSEIGMELFGSEMEVEGSGIPEAEGIIVEESGKVESGEMGKESGR